MNRALRDTAAPLRRPWHESHRGGVSCVVENLPDYAEAVESWHLALGLLQRLPYETRQANIAAGRFALELGGVPERALVFDVVAWQPATITLTVRFIEERVAQPQYEFWFLNSTEYL